MKFFANHSLWRLALCMILLLVSISRVWAGKVLNDTLVTAPFSHHIWQEVLSESVDGEGGVNFNGLRAYPKRLNQYLKQLEKSSPASNPEVFPDRNSALAYWLNAHNALALRLVLDRYPVKTLREIPNYRTDTRYRFGGKPYSLAQIETLVAQEFYARPQAFFALTDLSLSDPPLQNQAYRPDTLNQQLKGQMVTLAQLPRYVEITPNCSDPVRLAPVFRQFERVILAFMSNFTQSDLKQEVDPSLLGFIKPFLSPQLQGTLVSCSPQGRSVLFMPVDPRLNRLP